MNIRDISIKNKLIIMQVFTSVVVLGLCFIAFVYSHIESYKQRKVQNVRGIAQVIGLNSISPLDFRDNESASEILEDLKKESPDVQYAVIYDSLGHVFAVYRKRGTKDFLFPRDFIFSNRAEYTDTYLMVCNNIVRDGLTIGSVCLQVSLQELRDIKAAQYNIALVILIIGVGLSFLIATIVQNYISRSLLSLVHVMQQVRQTGFYTTPLQVRGRDEIGVLSGVFNEMMNQLQETQRKKDEFVGIASHELKTPLTSVKSYVQVLDMMEHEPLQRQYIQKTLANIKKLEKLIAELLDVSRIQSGQLQLNFSTFPLQPFLEQTIASYRVIAPSHQITLESTLGDETIDADAGRLEQVMTNLLSNAVKYSPASERVIVSADCENEHVHVRVTDFGLGIPEKERQKIFERFYRTPDNHHTISGFGLGLYICRDIIVRHGGRIWVDGAPGETVFHFTMPLRRTGKDKGFSSGHSSS